MGLFNVVKKVFAKAKSVGSKVKDALPGGLKKAQDTIPHIQKMLEGMKGIAGSLPDKVKGPLQTALGVAESASSVALKVVREGAEYLGGGNSDAQEAVEGGNTEGSSQAAA